MYEHTGTSDQKAQDSPGPIWRLQISETEVERRRKLRAGTGGIKKMM